MNHWWNMLEVVTRTALPKVGASGSGGAEKEKRISTSGEERNINPDSSEANQAQGKANHPSPKQKRRGNNYLDAFIDGEEDGSLSSVSFYEDFPTLYFAVRKGRCVTNSVFLSWDTARKHIVDYPDAEYIATPTLEQAHRYTNGFGEFDEDNDMDHEDSNPSPQEVEASLQSQAESSERLAAEALAKEQQKAALLRAQQKRKYTTRELVLEYYESYDPAYKAKGQKPLTISKFLKEKSMYKSKFKAFTKHWQRSGLLMMSNEEKPPEEAVRKYDSWVRNRKLEKLGIDPELILDQRAKANATGDEGGKSRKRKRPESNQNTADEGDQSTDVDKNSRTGQSSNSNNNNNKNNKNPPTKKRKQKPPPNKATTRKRRKNSILDVSIDASVLQQATKTTAKRLHTNNGNSEDEDDDNDEKWNAMYEKLKEFHSKHGHCKVSRAYNPELSYFVSYTRRRMNVEANRSGARALTLREEKLLNDLDFDPVYKEIVTEFNKYLGMRIAKLFDVEVDTDDEESSSDVKLPREKGMPLIKKIPFFGTVGRISSVCNRYLRIKYDDGDSEDFSLECLLKGLKLYQKYKHKDTLRDDASKIPAVGKSVGAAASGKNANKNGAKGDDKTDNTDMVDSRSRGNDSAAVDKARNMAKTPRASRSKTPNGKIDYEELEKIAKPILGENRSVLETNVTRPPLNITREEGVHRQATITPETKPSGNGENERRNRDHSSIDHFDVNGNGNGIENANGNRNSNGNGNDSDGDSTSSDEVEIVDVLVPYRPNPNLLVFPKTEVDDAMPSGNNGNNSFSIYEEGVFDF